MTILYPLSLRDRVQIFINHTLRILDNLSKFYHDLPKANIALYGGHRPCCTQSADSLAAASTFREDTGPCWPEFLPEAVLRVVSKEHRVNLNYLLLSHPDCLLVLLYRSVVVAQDRALPKAPVKPRGSLTCSLSPPLAVPLCLGAHRRSCSLLLLCCFFIKLKLL